MKLFQVNPHNYITTDSVSGITFEPCFAVVTTSNGAKQGRLLVSCFEVIKPIIEVTLLPNNN